MRRLFLRSCWLVTPMALACRLPPATLDLEPGEPPPVFGERDAAQAAAKPREALPPIARGECPGEVGDYPAVYFDEHVLIRLPSGVSEDSFVEVMPGFARSIGPVTSSLACRAGPPPVIEYMAMTMFDLVPDLPLEQFRDEVLEAYGYPEGTTLVAHDPGDGYSGKWVLDVPPTEYNPEPARALFAVISGHGIVIAILYEVHPDAWPVIVNTLLESADRISLLPG